MKYKEGDTVCLFDGRMVYVFAVDDNAKKYQVVNTEDEGTLFSVREKEIYMKIM